MKPVLEIARGSSIQTQLSAAFILILVSAVGTLTLTFNIDSRESRLDSIEPQSRIVVNTLVLALSDPFSRGEVDKVQLILDRAREQDGKLIYLIAQNLSGGLEAESRSNEHWRGLVDREFEQKMMSANELIRAPHPRAREVFEVAAPLRLSGRRVGVLRAGFSTASVSAHVRRTLATAAVVGLAGIVAIVVVSGRAKRRLMGALQSTVEAFEAAVHGDLFAEVKLGGSVEGCRAAEALNTVIEWMGTAHRQVRASANRLEERAGTIERASETLWGAAEEQSGCVLEAGESIARIGLQAVEIADSVNRLITMVDDSSSSVVEMTAAGEELRESAETLASEVVTTSTSVQQMLESVREVRCHADELGGRATETLDAMEKIAAGIRGVHQSAEQSALLSQQVVEIAEQGREKVRETVRGMNAIRQTSSQVEVVIRNLGERAREIDAILDVIDGVADETNLLALNASIIAAQAGEHGKAFSVVANEIKQLANRVIHNTKEIGGLIDSVQEESANATLAIERSSASIDAGVARSNEAGLALEGITIAARDSLDRMAEILEAVREETRATEHVASLMEGTTDGVEKIRHVTAEQELSADSLAHLANRMRELAVQVSTTTKEQSLGSVRIRQCIESVTEAVEFIGTALMSQRAHCGEVQSFLSTIVDGTRGINTSAKEIASVTKDLREEAASLRTNVDSFQV